LDLGGDGRREAAVDAEALQVLRVASDMSEPRKYTLKNLPEVYCEDYFDNGHVSSTMQVCSRDDMMKLHEWFEGFEKQLREELHESRNIQKNTSSELWREGARWLIKELEEILGDSE
jgi:hypothetical protein